MVASGIMAMYAPHHFIRTGEGGVSKLIGPSKSSNWYRTLTFFASFTNK